MLSAAFLFEVADMNIAICDSKKFLCDDIANLIRQNKPDAKIFSFTSKEDLLKCKENFSIFFLDIKGVEGLEIAKILRRRQNFLQTPPSILIFVTGFEDYTLEAFDVHAFHYLLKPIDAKKFSQVLNRACLEVENLEAQTKNFLLIKVGDFRKKIFLQDIYFAESDNKKVIFHTSDGNFETYGKMDAFEVALGENFYRCHRCYLVNLAKISAYNSNLITLANGEEILLASKKFSDFVKKFLNYAANGGLVNV